jgi:predicted nucleotidyltransferase
MSDSKKRFGLSEDEINKINSVFIKFPLVEKALVYGSRAKGNYRNYSDIDITLIGSNLNLTLQQTIEVELDDLLLPYKIDLSIAEKIENSDLINHISSIGKELFVRK